MARSLRIQFPGAFYHITCRGIERRKIFADDTDRSRFLFFLEESLGTYQVVLHAYILMTNHFHFLVQTKKANCSDFMRHFNIRYTGWFNWRHNRNGNLYQGRYKAFLIDADNYIIEVSRYLHLNSVRVKQMKQFDHRKCWNVAKTYRWSSLPGYVSDRRIVRFVDYGLILSLAGGRHEYCTFLKDGLKVSLENPFEKVKNRIILGSDDFITGVKRELKPGSVREQPSYRELVTCILEPDIVFEVLKREIGIEKWVLQRRKENGTERGIAAEMLYRYCEMTQSEIGGLLGGVDYGAVYLLRRRLKERMDKDSALRERYEKIESAVKHACRM